MKRIFQCKIVLAILTAFLLPLFANSQPTNSSVKADDYRTQARRIWHEYNLDNSTNSVDKLFAAGQQLQKDYPSRVNGYDFMMCAIEDCAYKNPEKARTWAGILASDSSAPERFKLWSKGFLYRLDSQGKQIAIKFRAIDGREVDLEKMNGKVVLVDFWSTGCVPCVAELPRVKAALEKYQAQDFAVIGVSCDTEKETLEKFLKGKQISWPQYFDGQQQERNKFTQEFGIDAIPHMFLIDKKGCLRFDNVRASGEEKDFEGKIEALLSEK